MKNLVGVFFLVAFGCATLAQTNVEIMRVEFSKLSRGGYYERVVITTDSVHVERKADRMDQAAQIFTRKLDATEWNSLLKSINNVSMSEISEFKSPTMKRSFDGAMHASIIITARNGEAAQHAFDDENPHQKLVPLMKAIRKLEKKTTK